MAIIFGFAFHTLLILMAVGKRQSGNTWVVDGSNLLAHQGTPNDPYTVAMKLNLITEGQADAVVLVFDGKYGDEERKCSEGLFESVFLAGNVSADDYILQHIRALANIEPKPRVNLVTADRELRREALRAKQVVRKCVNPEVFWRRYRPRLSRLKQKEYTRE